MQYDFFALISMSILSNSRSQTSRRHRRAVTEGADNTMSSTYTGWPKKSKPPPIFQNIALKIANEIRFLRKVKV